MSINIGDKVKLKVDHGYCYLEGSYEDIKYFKVTNINATGGMDYLAFDSDDNSLGSCSCWTVDDFEPYLKKYEIGDLLAVTPELRSACGDCYSFSEYIKITDVTGTEENPHYYFDSYSKDGSRDGSCSGHEDCFENLKLYEEPKQVADAPLAPTHSLVGTDTTTMQPGTTVQSTAPTARIGWMDEPVFIPKESQEEPVGTINIVPVTNAKHSANLRKLIGHRNFKSRVAA